MRTIVVVAVALVVAAAGCTAGTSGPASPQRTAGTPAAPAARVKGQDGVVPEATAATFAQGLAALAAYDGDPVSFDAAVDLAGQFDAVEVRGEKLEVGTVDGVLVDRLEMSVNGTDVCVSFAPSGRVDPAVTSAPGGC